MVQVYHFLVLLQMIRMIVTSHKLYSLFYCGYFLFNGSIIMMLDIQPQIELYLLVSCCRAVNDSACPLYIT